MPRATEPTDVRLALGAAACAVVYVARALPRLDSVVDDAYISARYSLHLALGHGLTYNPAEAPVEGYTNLLWVLQTAALWRVFSGDPHDMLRFLVWPGLAYGAVGVLGVAALTRALAGRPTWFALLPAGFLALDPNYAVMSTNGIESSQFVAFVTLAAASSLGGAPRALTAALCALLVAVRPEGLAVAGALALFEGWRWWQDRREPPGLAALGLAAGAVPVWLGRAVYFGAIVPNTWSAKTSEPFLEHLATNGEYFAYRWPYWVGIAVVAALAAVPAAVGAERTTRRAERQVALAIAAGLVLIALQVDEWMPGGRLYQPAIALILCAFATRLDAVWEGTTSGPLRVPALALGVGLVAGGLSFGWLPKRVLTQDRYHTALPGNGAEQAAEWIADHAPPNARIAMRDAGVMAYYVGPDVTVLETHERALTRRHPDGADTDPRTFVPRDVEFLVLTVQRKDSPALKAANDAVVLDHVGRPYRFLGRVNQHHHRYYDVYVRPDLAFPDLPARLLVPFDPATTAYEPVTDDAP